MLVVGGETRSDSSNLLRKEASSHLNIQILGKCFLTSLCIIFIGWLNEASVSSSNLFLFSFDYSKGCILFIASLKMSAFSQGINHTMIKWTEKLWETSPVAQMHDCTHTITSISQRQCKATHRDTCIWLSPFTISAQQWLLIAGIPLCCQFTLIHQYWEDRPAGPHQV